MPVTNGLPIGKSNLTVASVACWLVSTSRVASAPEGHIWSGSRHQPSAEWKQACTLHWFFHCSIQCSHTYSIHLCCTTKLFILHLNCGKGLHSCCEVVLTASFSPWLWEELEVIVATSLILQLVTIAWWHTLLLFLSQMSAKWQILAPSPFHVISNPVRVCSTPFSIFTAYGGNLILQMQQDDLCC